MPAWQPTTGSGGPGGRRNEDVDTDTLPWNTRLFPRFHPFLLLLSLSHSCQSSEILRLSSHVVHTAEVLNDKWELVLWLLFHFGLGFYAWTNDSSQRVDQICTPHWKRKWLKVCTLRMTAARVALCNSPIATFWIVDVLLFSVNIVLDHSYVQTVVRGTRDGRWTLSMGKAICWVYIVCHTMLTTTAIHVSAY